MLLGRSAYLSPAPDEGEVLVVGDNGWPPPGPGQSWSFPFEDLDVRNVGCEVREAPAGPIVPLALEFTGDEGLVSLAHGTVTHDVSVGGRRFDLVVAAFIDLEPFRPFYEVRVPFVAVRSGR